MTTEPKKEEKKEEKREEKKEEKKSEAAHAEAAKKAEVPSPQHPAAQVADSLSFAIIDVQRGISRLRQNSSATTPGTWVYDAIQYFDAAVARLDRSLALHRPGVRLSAEDRARERTRYEREYIDPTQPKVVNQ